MPDLSEFRYDGGRKPRLQALSTNESGGIETREEAEEHLRRNVEKLAEEQQKLYADGRWAMLVILQGMDAAGKDGAISHIMGGLNPQGTEVHSFKQPSAEELAHDYLWRAGKRLPERGHIGIFNRSYYEEVLVVRVHNLIGAERIPEALTGGVWKKRYRQINDFEQYLSENGIVPVKFFLHISREEQKRRLLERIEDTSKNWKFSEADIKERQYWDEYQDCYEEMIGETGTEHAPWYVIPADKKWFARLTISEAVVHALKSLDLQYPELDRAQLDTLEKYRKILGNGQA